jgi:hypothetical protein
MRAIATPRTRAMGTVSNVTLLPGSASARTRGGAAGGGVLNLTGRAVAATRIASRGGGILTLAGRAAASPRPSSRALAAFSLKGAGVGAPRGYPRAAASFALSGRGVAVPRPAAFALGFVPPAVPPAPWRVIAVADRSDRLSVPARGRSFGVAGRDGLAVGSREARIAVDDRDDTLTVGVP